jgi:Holliday junction DNA helicase RuvA
MLIHTIEHDDVNTLVKVPGLVKTAERLMIELRDRFKAFSQSLALHKQAPLKYSSWKLCCCRS